MELKDLKIVFMGTPDFAVASLDALVQEGCQVVGVVTAPDKPAGRGLKLQESAVKTYAVEKGLHLLQPLKLKDPAFLESLAALKADIQVVVAFRMLPEVVWNMPPMGTINVHGSLLPNYRGAAPINWAVINGEKETGVTTFKLQHAIDTGNILLQDKTRIDENATAGQVYEDLMYRGAKLLVKTLEGLVAGDIKEQEQAHLDPGDLKHAPKIFKEDGKIDWNQPIDKVYNLVRGLSPYPTAWTFLNDKSIKIFRAEKEYANTNIAAGHFFTDGKTFLKIAATDGYLKLLDVQMEGKKRMDIESFLRGVKLI
ncbi:methionyl-tRNA formyltransferase [Chitinophaga caeni]|nr:methionyl-tRNA formyltransferase [Chitinophaga caeni]